VHKCCLFTIYFACLRFTKVLYHCPKYWVSNLVGFLGGIRHFGADLMPISK
jgi:hypothetical protein